MFSISIMVYAQEDCKVLVEKLEGQYTGDCKKGLAHGNGEAIGIDTYIGEFKKGKPHGEGKYIDSSGDIHEGFWKKGKKEGYGNSIIYAGTDTVIKEGYWRDNKYYGKNALPYKVTHSFDVSKVQFFQKDKGDIVNLKFQVYGRPNYYIKELIVECENGHKDLSYRGEVSFYDIQVPFKVKMQYKTIKLKTSLNNDPSASQEIYCELEFEIYQQGSWDIIISN